MFKVFVCPDHDKPRGTCESWDSSGVVKSPDADLKALFQRLGLDDRLCLQANGRWFSLTWKNRPTSSDDETWQVSQADYDECEVHDCCPDGASARAPGKLK
jgi:hypothetical protein